MLLLLWKIINPSAVGWQKKNSIPTNDPSLSSMNGILIIAVEDQK